MSTVDLLDWILGMDFVIASIVYTCMYMSEVNPLGNLVTEHPLGFTCL